MKYLIMCGSNHCLINGVPRQLVNIRGERVVDRTIRLLRANYISDIAITATNPDFKSCDAEYIEYDSYGDWVNCFYPMDEPVCYIFGDVYFSEAAIQKIVETQTKDVEFFASAPPFHKDYIKPWGEPFAFKVVDTEHFKRSIATVKKLKSERLWKRDPIAWETWQVVKSTPINKIDYANYVVINDYTCDIDSEMDMKRLNQTL